MKNPLHIHQYLPSFTSESHQRLRLRKTTLHKTHKHQIITKTGSPNNVSVADLIAFDRLQTPIWIYDLQNLQMWWVNQASLHICHIQSREELLKNNLIHVSESTSIRWQNYLNQFEQGKIIAENWTFYPPGQPVSVRCLCSGIQIEPGRMGILVEGVIEDNQIPDGRDEYLGKKHVCEDIALCKQITDAFKAGEARWQYALEGNGDGVWDWNSQTNEVFLSRRWKEMLGFADHEIGNQSSEWEHLLHPDDQGRTFQELQQHLLGLTPQYVSEYRIRCKDGTYKWILARGKVISRCHDGSPLRMLGTHTDITERKLMEEALQQQVKREQMMGAIAQRIRQSLNLEEILNTTATSVRQFLQMNWVMIYRFHPDGSGVIVTESVAEEWRYLGDIQEKLIDQTMLQVIPDIHTPEFRDFYLMLWEKLPVRANLMVPIVPGDSLWGLLIIDDCNHSRQSELWQGELLKQLATQLAIAIQQSELYQKLQLANQQLQDLVMVDQLTQIPNRRFFDYKLNYAWQILLREKCCLSLLLCDIDYFKRYNDTYGHASGDTCLALVAQTIQKTVKRSTDLVARYGGEEFAVILLNTDSEGAAQVALEIHQAIQQLNIPHQASAVQPWVTLSIGIATVTAIPHLVPLDLIQAVDQALYQAKAQGRNRSFVST